MLARLGQGKQHKETYLRLSYLLQKKLQQEQTIYLPTYLPREQKEHIKE